MKRKAFLLTEQLTTILLQAGFILVLLTSFYLFLNFYTKKEEFSDHVILVTRRAWRVNNLQQKPKPLSRDDWGIRSQNSNFLRRNFSVDYIIAKLCPQRKFPQCRAAKNKEIKRLTIP